MNLILSLGSNMGDRLYYLREGRRKLGQIFYEEKCSDIYESTAVDYTDQPPFLNQVIQYKKPAAKPAEILPIILEIERKLHRIRDIPKGPRTLDIDIIFFGETQIFTPKLQIPHPEWHRRSFVYWPLHDLPAFSYFKNIFFQGEEEVPNDLIGKFTNNIQENNASQKYETYPRHLAKPCDSC